MEKSIYARIKSLAFDSVALGAGITITVSEEGKDRIIVTDITSGASFGASSFRMEMGLGKSKSVKSIEIQRPQSSVL